MPRCWSENPEERPSFLQMAQDINSVYGLNDPTLKDGTKPDRQEENTIQLKYAILTIHENSLKQQV